MAILRNKKIFYTLYALGSFLFFLWYLFPSDFFADYLENMIRQHGNGVKVTIQEAKPTLGLSLSLNDVVCEIPSGPTLEAESFIINPGLFSLLGNNPEVSFKVDGFGGRISGHIMLPEKNPNKMTVDDIKISNLDLFTFKDLLSSYIPGYTVRGRLDAQGHYTQEGRGNGELMFKVKDLVVEPEKPFFTIKNLTFSEVRADFEIKSRKIQIRQCEADGKEVNGTVSGSVFMRKPMDRSTLRLSGTLRPEKEFLDTLGASMPVEALLGNKMNDAGEIGFRLSGVARSPRFSLR